MKMLTAAVLEPLPVQAAREGDAAAWDSIIRRYQLPLFTYIHELVRDEQTSLDLVQETFLSAVRHLGTLREDHRLGSWLFGIAHQKCIQQWRRRERWKFTEAEPDEDWPDAADDPCDGLLRREQEETLMNLVARLPLPQRAVFLLHVLEELPLHEIAIITNAPVGTVKSRLHHARLALRRQLDNSP